MVDKESNQVIIDLICPSLWIRYLGERYYFLLRKETQEAGKFFKKGVLNWGHIDWGHLDEEGRRGGGVGMGEETRG